MVNKTFGTFSELGGSTFAAYQSLVSINAKAVQRLSQAQQDLISKSLEAGMEQWSASGTAESLQDVLTSQSKLMQAQSERLVHYAQTTAEILKETQEELQQWIKEASKPLAT